MEDSITCHRCGLTSHNPNDVRERWCGKCEDTIHEPWTPWSIWHSAQLPEMAFERLAAGGIWRIQEPNDPRDALRVMVDPGEAYKKTYRIAVYKIGRSISYGKATILGQWEGDREWVEVGWIEGG